MSDQTPRVPELWWSPEHGVLESFRGSYCGVDGQTVLDALPANVVKLGPVPKDIPIGMVRGDFYSPDEVIELMAERDARIAQLEADAVKLGDTEAAYQRGVHDARPNRSVGDIILRSSKLLRDLENIREALSIYFDVDADDPSTDGECQELAAAIRSLEAVRAIVESETP